VKDFASEDEAWAWARNEVQQRRGLLAQQRGWMSDDFFVGIGDLMSR
jgi:hypothetical protein